MQYEILRGDCINQMRAMPDNSFDSIVCDPPYELGFMGKSWDASGIAYSVEMWAEAWRVLKPGGHLLAFSGSRTYHRMTCAIEDAGFEIRDQILWVYGSGFPKSLDVSKAIDKANGRGLEDWYELGRHIRACRLAKGLTVKAVNVHFGGTALCNHWEAQNQNNAIPPTPEHWEILKDWLGCSAEYDEIVDRAGAIRDVIGQKTAGMGSGQTFGMLQTEGQNDKAEKQIPVTAPATDAARQWEGWGTALKPAHEPICVARKPLAKGATVAANVLQFGTGALNIDGCRVPHGDDVDMSAVQRQQSQPVSGFNMAASKHGVEVPMYKEGGRWPANIIHDGSDEVVGLFPDSNGGRTPAKRGAGGISTSGHTGQDAIERDMGDGSAARFFYCAKASKSDRGPNNTHPTVKPLALMQYLCRLVTPPGGRILDPFAGSGSTIVAALREGFIATGIELLDDHADIIEGRLDDELYGDLL